MNPLRELSLRLCKAAGFVFLAWVVLPPSCLSFLAVVALVTGSVVLFAVATVLVAIGISYIVNQWTYNTSYRRKKNA